MEAEFTSEELAELRVIIKERRATKNPSCVYKFSDEVNLSGVSDAINTKSQIGKWLWILVFLACLAGLAYFTYNVFEEYSTEPTATKVHMARREKYPYPPIVLCIDTWLDANKAFDMGLTADAIEYALSYLILPSDLGTQKRRASNFSSTAKAEFEKVYEKEKFRSLLDFYKAISVKVINPDVENGTADDVQFRCKYCPDDFAMKSIIFETLLCHVVDLNEENPEKQAKNISTTRQDGTEAIKPYFDLSVRAPDPSAGILKSKSYWRLYIDPVLDRGLPLAPFLSIEKGFSHAIYFTTTEYRMINTDREPCVEDVKDGSNGTAYFARRCSTDCLGEAIHHWLNCRSFNVESFSNRTPREYCNSYDPDQWKTPPPFDVAYSKLTSCAEKCQPKCHITNYNAVIDRHVSEFETNETDISKQGNVSAFKITFINNDRDSGGIIVYTEFFTYSLDTFVSNIGGLFGIFLGTSVLTVVQLIVFCPKSCLRHRSKQPTMNSSDGKPKSQGLINDEFGKPGNSAELPI